MSKKILFTSGEGIGNVLQCAPTLRTLKEVLGYDIDFWFAFGAYPINGRLFPYVDKWIVGPQIRHLNPSEYEGMVSTWWTRDYIKQIPLTLLNKPTSLSQDRSEVDVYMDIARDLGAKENDVLWHGECNYKRMDEEFDIVMHNGYKLHGGRIDWSVKSYPYYEEVVRLLGGYKICSVGAPYEYVKGTDNKTGMHLFGGLGLIKNSKLFLSNDSGLYHCANALRTKNIVIFTATSIAKNYNQRFHKYSTIIGRDDLECRPCQKGLKWQKGCKKWECREIDPEIIANKVRELVDGN